MKTSDDFDLIIEPGRIEKNYWLDLWRFRELFYILSWRDIKVRYKQTVIGAAWSIIRPLLTMIVFTIVFGKLANLPSEGTAPYIIMVYAAMLPWQFFSNSLTESSNSILGSAHLISKVYFPRIIIPASSVMVSLVDFFISFTILLLLFAVYQFVPSWHIIFLPFFIVFAFSIAFGLGMFLTALNVKYRDFRYIIPFIVQIGFYISPVGFSSTVIPAQWKLLYSLNPMVGVIEGFRWCIIGNEGQLYLPGLFISFIINLLCFMAGIRFFRKMEKSFADVI
jgi:lipopolysaccharide transport system permease protein